MKGENNRAPATQSLGGAPLLYHSSDAAWKQRSCPEPEKGCSGHWLWRGLRTMASIPKKLTSANQRGMFLLLSGDVTSHVLTCTVSTSMSNTNSEQKKKKINLIIFGVINTFFTLQNNSQALLKYLYLHPNAWVGFRYLLLFLKTTTRGHHWSITPMGRDTTNNLVSICCDPTEELWIQGRCQRNQILF